MRLGGRRAMMWVGGSFTFDADTTSWKNAVIANGGTVTDARLRIVNSFVVSEKASGNWSLTDDYWGLWAESEIQALTSLKQRRLASAINIPVFTANRGYVGDALTSYIDTLFIPSTHGIALTGNSMHISWYERTNSTDPSFIGINDTANRFFSGRSRSAGNQARSDLNSGGNVASSITDSRGGWDFIRQVAPTFEIYRDGVDMASTQNVSSGTTQSSNSFPLLAHKTAAVADTFSGRSFGFFAVGGGLSPAQVAARSIARLTWATAVGANV